MKIEWKVGEFFWDNIGKIAVISGAATIAAIGAFFGFSKDGLKTTALALSAASAAAAGASTATWKMKDHVEQQAEQIDNMQSQYKNEKKKLRKEAEQKRIEGAVRNVMSSTESQKLSQKADEIKEQNEKSLKLHTENNIINDEHHAEVIGILKKIIEKDENRSHANHLVENDNRSRANNPVYGSDSAINLNRLFSEPKTKHKRKYKPKHKAPEYYSDSSQREYDSDFSHRVENKPH